jgi:hypothetical protein
MLPEDRLDNLLTRLQAGERLHSAALRAEAGELAPLLDAVSPFAAWGEALPSPAFTNRLERQLLKRSAAQQRSLPVSLPPSIAVSTTGASAGARPRHIAQRVSRLPIPPRVLWPALVAVFLLALGGSTLAAAANAAPGQALYGMRRWEQGVSVSLSSGAGDRVRLHVRYANDALAAFTAAVDEHAGEEAYHEALATLHDETAAAAVALQDVPAGQEHTSLAGQLEGLQAQARAILRASLPALSWHNRALVTTALGGQGETVLQVTHATLARVGTDSHDAWKVTITGASFQLGAVLLVNGSPAGAVVSVTPTQLVAQLPDSAVKDTPGSLGVGNPDRTASITGAITQIEDQNGGGDNNGNNNGGSGGGDNATSSPTPGHASPTPTDTGGGGVGGGGAR